LRTAAAARITTPIGICDEQDPRQIAPWIGQPSADLAAPSWKGNIKDRGRPADTTPCCVRRRQDQNPADDPRTETKPLSSQGSSDDPFLLIHLADRRLDDRQVRFDLDHDQRPTITPGGKDVD
jgi:hypothetical protein